VIDDVRISIGPMRGYHDYIMITNYTCVMSGTQGTTSAHMVAEHVSALTSSLPSRAIWARYLALIVL
jgi:hypothetical protein